MSYETHNAKIAIANTLDRALPDKAAIRASARKLLTATAEAFTSLEKGGDKFTATLGKGDQPYLTVSHEDLSGHVEGEKDSAAVAFYEGEGWVLKWHMRKDQAELQIPLVYNHQHKRFVGAEGEDAVAVVAKAIIDRIVDGRRK